MKNNVSRNRKRYIIITSGLTAIGGAELYIANKCNWLKKNGWETHVLSAAYSKKTFPIIELREYQNSILPILHSAPFEMPEFMVHKALNKMIALVGGKRKNVETIIESHYGALSLWGELLAEQLRAKNVFVPIGEVFDEKSYYKKQGYFRFKLKRRESFCGKHAFYAIYGENADYPTGQAFCIQEDPVKNIENNRVNSISKCDYNICYIGRTEKSYFENIAIAVKRFAEVVNDKTVQFIVVGDTSGKKEFIYENFNNSRIKLNLLGDVFPIPRKLFDKIDVVMAGAGSAKCAAYEGVYTIVADCDNNMSNGVLGIDTLLPVGRDENTLQHSFEESLMDILIYKKYDKKKISMPKKKTVDDCCKQNIEKIADSLQCKKYYGYRNICFPKSSKLYYIEAFLRGYFPSLELRICYFSMKLGVRNKIVHIAEKGQTKK